MQQYLQGKISLSELKKRQVDGFKAIR